MTTADTKPRLRRMNGAWWCSFPPKSIMMNQVTTAHGNTPKDAYNTVMRLLKQDIEDPFIPPAVTPQSEYLHRQWQEAESRVSLGMSRTYSSLDNAVRNGRY